ncbi:hypothetical protein FOMPIDRAFT_1013385 [Fomitopsis schrenkii]|uniref:Uncharacterized protein n=1 Tax=Fomitopsis schrenkii TaxID=2126942 RepID=S8FX84_FOMSC|nr:hypothetical protein FOMPIDRAFT_1013385 [Fomitopsis schrenkii]
MSKRPREEEQTTPSIAKRTKKDEPRIPLPTLTITPSPNLYVVEIIVSSSPTAEERNGLTWIVEERPATRAGAGMYIQLRTREQQSGIGRIGHVIMMRKHWITFAINNARQVCTIRVPTAWASLSALERHTHATRYHLLPDTPRPLPALRNSPNLTGPADRHHKADATMDEAQMERHLYKIANARPIALHTSHHTTHHGLLGDVKEEPERARSGEGDECK